MVLPEDVQAVLPAFACHRLRLVNTSRPCRAEDIAELIHAIPDPLMRLVAVLAAMAVPFRPRRTAADRPRPAPHLHRADARPACSFAVVLA
jgi:hypothetical protein